MNRSQAEQQFVSMINFDKLESKKSMISIVDSLEDEVVDLNKRPPSENSHNSFSDCELSNDDDSIHGETLRNGTPLDSSRWKAPGLAFESPPMTPKKRFVPELHLKQFRA